MEGDQELRRYFFMLLRWWWLVLLCAALAGGAAYFLNSQAVPVYSASSTLFVSQAPTGASSDTSYSSGERLAQTYSKMLTGRPVLQQVIADLGLPETPGSLASRVRAGSVQGTSLVQVTVEDSWPERAAAVANAVANTFVRQNQALHQQRYVDSLTRVQTQMNELSALIEETQAKITTLAMQEEARSETALDSLIRQTEARIENLVARGDQATTEDALKLLEEAQADLKALAALQAPESSGKISSLETVLSSYRTTYATLLQNYEQMRLASQSVDYVVLFAPAEAPSTPIRPKTAQNTMLATAVGAALAVGVAFLVEYLDDTLKTPDDVQESLGLSTLGVIGRLSAKEEWVVAQHPRSPLAEAYRMLRTNIRFSSVDKPLHTLLVTSASRAEGKSISSVNLAAAMAQADLRVVLVDGDLRRPRVHKLLGLTEKRGLTEALFEQRVDGNLQPVAKVTHLRALAAGSLPPNPAELLGSQRMEDLLQELKSQSDVVVIDCPPVLAVADTAVLSQKVDGVLLVVQAGATRRGVAQRAVENLRQVGANVIGAVLNAVPSGRGGYYSYYRQDYYYRDVDAAGQPEGTKRRTKRRPGLVRWFEQWLNAK